MTESERPLRAFECVELVTRMLREALADGSPFRWEAWYEHPNRPDKTITITIAPQEAEPGAAPDLPKAAGR